MKQQIDLNDIHSAAAMIADLTVIILTYNEEKHIERCIRSAFQIASRMFVVDSFSTDQTVAIAQSLGAQVWQHEFRNHAAQLAWALENLPIDTGWVMRVDADEVIDPALAEEMRGKLSSVCAGTNGYLVYRLVCFEGKVIRHGGVSHWVLRLWRKGMAKVEQRWMDEHMVLKSGDTERLKGEFLDDNLNNIAWWTNKHNSYSTREAIDLLNKKYRFLSVAADSSALTCQARYKRWLKENLYARLPLGLGHFCFLFTA